MPFLASAALVAPGLCIGLKLTETAASTAALRDEAPPRVPVSLALREHLGAAAAGTLGVVACFALYYIATAFALGYCTTRLGHDRQLILKAQPGAILFIYGRRDPRRRVAR